jgi:ketosteroid isomerase-like protein
MTYMNSNELPFSNHTGAYLVRPLGALEEFIWLLDQSRPAHFVMAAEVSGSTILSDWWRALDFVQARHPLLSILNRKTRTSGSSFLPTHRMKKAGLLVTIMTLLVGNMNAETQEQEVINTVSTVFTAAATDDTSKFNSVIAPGFYIFDGGLRFNGDTIMAFIKAQHASGKHYEWNVTEPDVHISGDTAWIAYVNKGSITDASGTTQLKWLESAFLQKQAGSWKIVFMHSTRVPPKQIENRGQ